jgi:hypothetical protein
MLLFCTHKIIRQEQAMRIMARSLLLCTHKPVKEHIMWDDQ